MNLSSRPAKSRFSNGGLEVLHLSAKLVRYFRELPGKQLQVVALFHEDGDVAPKLGARSRHGTAPVGRFKSPLIFHDAPDVTVLR
jgi:hypothetical protein